MNLLIAIAIAAVVPGCVMYAINWYNQILNEVELFGMGCHPRQLQLERKWK